MNQCFFVGNLTDNPKVTELNNTFVASFTLAVESYRTNKLGERFKSVEYLDFDAWDSGAVSIGKYYKKGDKLAVSAEARQHSWTGKDGNVKYKIIFRVGSFSGFNKKDES